MNMISRLEGFYIKNYRVTPLHSHAQSHLNSLFIPGGPGLGSEYLHSFAQNLQLPGQSFLVDFPGDGANRCAAEHISWESWKTGLLSVVRYHSPCVLITHSFSGMIALSIPELENELSGLVLMNTTPVANTESNMERIDLSLLAEVGAKYSQNPNDSNLKKLIDVYSTGFFLPHELEEGKQLIDLCSINAASFQWAWQYFFSTYEAKWIPHQIPCLVLSADGDPFCPPSVFSNNSAYSTRKNIKLHQINNAGHFPWLSAFAEIKAQFDLFYQSFNKYHKSQ